MLCPGTVPIPNLKASIDADSLKVLVPRLLKLKSSVNAVSLCVPLQFSPAAQVIQHELSVEHKDLTKLFERTNRKLATALGKQDGLFARLCVIWHCCLHAGGGGTLPVTVSEDTARRVATFMRQFTRPHLFDFYEAVLALPEEYERLQSIAGYILSAGLTVVTNRLVQAAVWSARKLTSKDITPVLEQLDAMGWLTKGVPMRGGAPPPWMVNPEVHTLFAARAVSEATRRTNSRNAILQASAAIQRHIVNDD
jgi:hypothetical protein